MLGNEVEVHRVIPQELYDIATKAFTFARLAFPHLVYHLCEATRICIDRDTPIDVDRPITKRGIEYAKEAADNISRSVEDRASRSLHPSAVAVGEQQSQRQELEELSCCKGFSGGSSHRN
ncbi:hypothetical protein AHAS_Ahas02G0151500 [Arachis hypogaea]